MTEITRGADIIRGAGLSAEEAVSREVETNGCRGRALLALFVIVAGATEWAELGQAEVGQIWSGSSLRTFPTVGAILDASIGANEAIHSFDAVTGVAISVICAGPKEAALVRRDLGGPEVNRGEVCQEIWSLQVHDPGAIGLTRYDVDGNWKSGPPPAS